MYFKLLIPLFLLLLLSSVVSAQNDKNKRLVLTDTLPELELDPQDTASTDQNKKKKKKKLKKGLYYGQKCKKGFAVYGTGDRQIVETFWYLKEWKDPNPYIDEIYVWDVSTGKVTKVPKIDPKKMTNYRILHGPYKKMMGAQLLEEGIFYEGVKHGRWEKYARMYDYYVLVGKEKYIRGWPKEAKITYYDNEYQKVKEVLPYEFGEMTGEYYFFYEDGTMMTKGYYEKGAKVGLWVEYFPNKKRRRETQYPEDPFDKETAPIIKNEWDEKGLLIIKDDKPVPKGQQTQTKDPIRDRFRKKK